MFAFLMSVGILASVAGLAAIGFGIPNNGFDVGNTLIMAGSTGLAAGLVLIGLAACVRELRRIADAAPARAARPARGDQAEAPAQRGAHSPRIPYPPKPDGREHGAVEPRLDLPGASASEEPAERPRSNVFAMVREVDERPLPEDHDPIPLVVTRGPASPVGRPPAAERPYEPKFGPADILARLGAPRGRGDGPPPVSERAPRPPAEPPALEPERERGNMFEGMWPSAGRPPRPAGPDTIARVPKPDPKPDPRVDMREPDEPPMNGEAREPVSRPAADARAISILKSGAIDGMAYTLYTDGSIEAQLPQGTMRFASIEELRTHLERHG